MAMVYYNIIINNSVLLIMYMCVPGPEEPLRWNGLPGYLFAPIGFFIMYHIVLHPSYNITSTPPCGLTTGYRGKLRKPNF